MLLLDPSYTMTTTTKKRDYQWMLDILPALALGQFCSKWLLTVFHGTPEASGWVAAISLAIGGGVGFVLSSYLRAQVTNIIQNRRTAFIVSFSVSLGLALAIVTATVLLTKPREISYEEAVLLSKPREISYVEATAATPIEQNSLVPDATNSALQQTKALAEQGNHIAQINLGAKYKFGLGVTQDYQEALKWFHLSAAQGNIFAPGYLVSCHASNAGYIV